MFAFPSRSSGVVLAAVGLLSVPAWAQEQETARLQGLLFQLKQTIEAEAERYSIGIAAEPAEKNGLAVREVMPNSAAAKAGLQKGDLITALNRAPLNKLEDLARAIAESKGEALHLQINRDGKAQGITVKPERRAGGLLQIIEEAEEGRTPQKPNPGTPQRQPDGNPATRLQPRTNPPGSGWVPGPGQPGAMARAMSLMTGPQSPHAPLPDDMEVTISKKGNKPAVIKVTQGVKTWKTDETELGMLPVPAQAYVARHLSKPQMGIGMMPANPVSDRPQVGPQGGPQLGGPLQFQLKLGEDGGVEKAPLNASPTNPPKVKQLPGGGLQIEIREADQKEQPKSKKEPEDKKKEPAQGAGPRFKVIPGGIEVEIGEK